MNSGQIKMHTNHSSDGLTHGNGRYRFMQQSLGVGFDRRRVEHG